MDKATEMTVERLALKYGRNEEGFQDFKAEVVALLSAERRKVLEETAKILSGIAATKEGIAWALEHIKLQQS